MLGGRFVLGVGTGEALNEHILGGAWPSLDVRLEMLEEAVELIRELWTGEVVTRQGKHYQVDTARIYTLPDKPPPIYMSRSGPRRSRSRAGSPTASSCTQPDADMVQAFKEKSGGKPDPGRLQGRLGADTATRASTTPTGSGPTPGCRASWPRCCRRPQHFEQASQLVTRESPPRDSVVAGPDVDEHVEQMRRYVAPATTRCTSRTWGRTTAR